MSDLITSHACNPWTYTSRSTDGPDLKTVCIHWTGLRLCDRPPDHHAGVHPAEGADTTICNLEVGGCGLAFPDEQAWFGHYKDAHQGAKVDEATNR